MSQTAIHAIIAACLLAGGWFARVAYDNSVELQIERVRAAVALDTAKAISEIKTVNQTTYAKTVEKVKTETVYGGCKADDAMMNLTNSVLLWK